MCSETQAVRAGLIRYAYHCVLSLIVMFLSCSANYSYRCYSYIPIPTRVRLCNVFNTFAIVAVDCSRCLLFWQHPIFFHP